MTELIDNKEKIKEIIEEYIKGKKIIYTDKYWVSIMRRNIPHEKVLEVFSQFNKVFIIEKDILRFGDVGYELFYNLGDNTTFSIATCPKDNKILIIHAVEYKRSLDKRFKNFGSK